MMRVLVCGGRDFVDVSFIRKTLDSLAKNWPDDTVIIDGDARGVDRIAGYWARKRRLENWKFPADWETHGKSAGPVRNQKMLTEGKPDLVVAFPGGKGTADMVRRARAVGVEVVEILES